MVHARADRTWKARKAKRLAALLMTRHILRDGGLFPSELTAAVYFGAYERVKTLLDAGASAYRRFNGNSLLLYASDCRVAALLIRAHLYTVGGDEYLTPLREAVVLQRVDLVELFVTCAAELLVPLPRLLLYYPLMAAAKGRSREIIRLLLQAGADPNGMTADRRVPLEVARTAAAVEELVRGGALVSGRGIMSPVEAAIHRGLPDVVVALVKAGAKIRRGLVLPVCIRRALELVS
jgi:hypothetical protein